MARLFSRDELRFLRRFKKRDYNQIDRLIQESKVNQRDQEVLPRGKNPFNLKKRVKANWANELRKTK